MATTITIRADLLSLTNTFQAPRLWSEDLGPIVRELSVNEDATRAMWLELGSWLRAAEDTLRRLDKLTS